MPEMSGRRASWMRVVAEDSRHNHPSVSKRLKCQNHSPSYNKATKVPGPLKPTQPVAWQKQAQLKPWSVEIVPLGLNLLDIQATIWLSLEKSLHPVWGAVIVQIQQMETTRWVITVYPSPSSCLCRCFAASHHYLPPSPSPPHKPHSQGICSHLWIQAELLSMAGCRKMALSTENHRPQRERHDEDRIC